VPDQEEDPFLDTEAVARRVGVTVGSVRVYLKRSRRRLKEGEELRPQDLPLPDQVFGRSPAWRESTITTWIAHRSGPGRPAAG
jgi:predicted DNA-binding transcriptional regulator AlpA